MQKLSRWAMGAGVLLVATAAIAGSPTTTTTITSTSTTTTTTTLFGGCVVEASYTSVLCRLDALVSFVGSATDLGRVQGGAGSSAAKARKQCGKASQSTGKVASNQLKKCAKTLDTFRHKLDSHSAKQIVPEATRSFLRNDVVSPLRGDVNTLRGTL
jgi:hypothetical protein